MHPKTDPALERGRMLGTPGQPDGAYRITGPKRKLNIICGVCGGWEHVSVSIDRRKNETPTWDEMCFVKNLFWSEDEVVVQYHPAKADYVNIHPGVLHLWRPLWSSLPTPPKSFV